MKRPPFIQTIHHLYLNSADRKGRDTGNNKMEQRSQELDWDMHMSCMHFHSLPSARVISVGPVCDPQNQIDDVHAFPFSFISEGNFCRARLRSSKSDWRNWSDRNDPKGQGTPCGQCRHRVRARIPPTFKCWWSPSSAHWIPVSSSTSLRASIVCALATHQIWTNGYRAHHRLRAYARWLHTCIPQVMWINPSRVALAASTPST